ncbi:IS30 family transposase [Sediminibacterium sp. C3]|uniref:IS30 family transposase n=1 Tax=Sediminibacterium sp. C3 TaxID=1267211 RepID=UPI00047B3773|nr:IS30 family transposase [Sediminibacterium sp. C3]
MTKNYTQLSLIQRYQIEAFIKAGMKQKKIAEHLGVNPSTISRELKRNTAQRGRTAGTYLASNAQRRTEQRHQFKPKLVKFNLAMKKQAVRWLSNEKWSPELISVKGKETGKCPLSIEWLYQWIWQSKHGNKAADKPYKRIYLHLKHARRRKKRTNQKDNRGIIPNRVPIEKRPKIVNKRIRPGDIEVDFMMGKNHKGALLVMTDRATLHTSLHKLSNRRSETVSKAIIKKLEQADYPIHTVTFDNDLGFANHNEVAEALNVDTYFTRPYTSQDKGTVENRIGQIRRFFPKKTDLSMVTDYQVKRVEQLLNNRPVRKFNYLTPNQVLQQKIALIT